MVDHLIPLLSASNGKPITGKSFKGEQGNEPSNNNCRSRSWELKVSYPLWQEGATKAKRQMFGPMGVCRELTSEVKPSWSFWDFTACNQEQFSPTQYDKEQ